MKILINERNKLKNSNFYEQYSLKQDELEVVCLELFVFEIET